MTKLPPDMERLRRALLKQSGWVDLENSHGQVDPECRQHGQIDYDKAIAGDYDALAEYYRLAGAHLHACVWPDDESRAVWEMHADGASYIRICRRLKLPMRRVQAVVTGNRAAMLGIARRGRGRPRDPGAGRRVYALRLNDAVSAALERVANGLGMDAHEAIRHLISEVDKRIGTGK